MNFIESKPVSSESFHNRVHQGDCIEVMRTFRSASIDFVLTDPPYLVNYASNDGRTVPNDDNDAWLKPAFAEIYRLLRWNRFCVSFYAWNRADKFITAWRDAGLHIAGHLTFVKKYASRKRFLAYAHENAYLLAKGSPSLPAQPISDVIDSLGDKSLMIAVKNIARRLGDDISEAKPILDSRLPDGSRVAVVIPPCSLDGVTLTIRKFNAKNFDLDDLVQAGTLERWLANQLEDYVLARKNILISGGTSCGKTTLLSLLGKFIPADERILLIEDTSEIHLDHQNLVRFEARQPQNSLPAVTIRDLLKASLRHRPDRLILGEIRGGEAFDLLQLLNTGHSGTLSTLHAASARQALARLTSCVLQSGVELPYKSLKMSLGHSIDVIVQLERRPGRRYVSEVVVVNGYDPDCDEYDFAVVFSSERSVA